MLVYDIPKKILAREIKINPIYIDYLYTNQYGLNIFQICRTSDITDIDKCDKKNSTHHHEGEQDHKKSINYKVNFQIFVLF